MWLETQNAICTEYYFMICFLTNKYLTSLECDFNSHSESPKLAQEFLFIDTESKKLKTFCIN